MDVGINTTFANLVFIVLPKKLIINETRTKSEKLFNIAIIKNIMKNPPSK